MSSLDRWLLLFVVAHLLPSRARAEERLPDIPLIRVEAEEAYISACFVSGGKFVLAATADGRVRRLDAGTLERRSELALPYKDVLRIGTRDAEKSIAVGLADGTVRVCDGDTGKERSRIDAGAGACTALAVAPDARLIGTGMADGRLRLGWVPTREALHEIPAHEGAIREVAFTSDSRIVMTAGEDRVWRVWEVATGGCVLEWDGPRVVGALAFHPAGWRVATGMDEDVITGYTTGGRVGAGIDRSAGNVQALAFSPDGRRLFAADDRGSIEVWDVSGLQIGVVQADRLGSDNMRDRWLDLAASEAVQGIRTVEFLRAHADEFIAYATERDKPIRADEEAIRKLVKDLSSEWEAGWAVQELEQLGEAARPYLAEAPDGEERSLLLGTVGRPIPRTPFALRNLREVQLMETLGSDKARALLLVWAGGHPLARLTQDARAALARLERK